MKLHVVLSMLAIGTAMAFPSVRRQECGADEVQKDCGTACPLTCDNYENPPDACPAVCVEGCFCTEGLVRNADDECVKPASCPAPAARRQECGPNEVHSDCGTACPLTCDNHANPPDACPDVCVVGCFCAEGLVRNADDECVEPTTC